MAKLTKRARGFLGKGEMKFLKKYGENRVPGVEAFLEKYRQNQVPGVEGE